MDGTHANKNGTLSVPFVHATVRACLYTRLAIALATDIVVPSPPRSGVRESLASIADRVEKGESFVVVRNSKPVFRILPVVETAYDQPRPGREPMILREMTERFDAAGESISEAEVDRIIHEVHERP